MVLCLQIFLYSGGGSVELKDWGSFCLQTLLANFSGSQDLKELSVELEGRGSFALGTFLCLIPLVYREFVDLGSMFGGRGRTELSSVVTSGFYTRSTAPNEKGGGGKGLKPSPV